MYAHKTRKRFHTGDDQLSLNFTDASSTRRKRGLLSTSIVVSSKCTFHSQESEIGKNSFSLKISYMGRSYTVKGMYKREEIRSFYQESFSNTAVRIIRFDSILAFRDGRYVSAFLPKKEYDEITKGAHNILSVSGQSTVN